MTMTLKELYDEQGFVVVPGLLPPQLFADLASACERIVARTRSGNWPHRRTVGKQFPPYGDDNPDSWGVQHVMHPALGESVFAEWYCSDPLVDIVKQLLECEEDDLQMELFNLLINPMGHSFALRWHRDDVSEKATEEEEKKALTVWHHGVQWNTALYEDRCLYIVPRSHKQTRSSEQRAHSSTIDPPKDPTDMPGAMQVVLKAGETVFHNSNILHCATYDCATRRATLHASMGDKRGGSTRARNILQHGLEWMKGEAFVDTLDPRGKAMLRQLIALQEATGNDVGYSLDG